MFSERKSQNFFHTKHTRVYIYIIKEVHAPPSDVVCDRFEVFVSPFVVVGLLRVFLFFERSRRCFREIEQQQQQQQQQQTRRGDDDEKKKKLRFENDERDYEQ
jgi:hypothetical protein